MYLITKKGYISLPYEENKDKLQIISDNIRAINKKMTKTYKHQIYLSFKKERLDDIIDVDINIVGQNKIEARHLLGKVNSQLYKVLKQRLNPIIEIENDKKDFDIWR